MRKMSAFAKRGVATSAYHLLAIEVRDLVHGIIVGHYLHILMKMEVVQYAEVT